jgi:UDP-N-acetylmuramyl pentapeptide phosphotransferase/UDP-N-acetylglucosamine-1-phosphate transferase
MLTWISSAWLGATLATLALLKVGGLALDRPNERSSHTTPTPRGGGLAIALAASISALLGIAATAGDGGTPSWSRAGVLLAAAATASAIGGLDDRYGLSARLRLVMQIAIAGSLALAGLRWNWLALPGVDLAFPLPLSILISILWVVWGMNFFNFMDGINGIATAQALVACAFYGWLSGAIDPDVTLVALATFGAAAGFLPFNFPRAHIFMGDCGSLYLGTIIASLPLALHQTNPSFTIWHAVLATLPFFADAAITLLRRIAGRESLAAAHRTHAYQLLASRLGNHHTPTAIYATLAMLGAAAAYLADRGLLATLAATGFAAGVCLWFGGMQLAYWRSRRTTLSR